MSTRASEQTLEEVDPPVDPPVGGVEEGFATTAIGPADIRDTPHVKPSFPIEKEEPHHEEDPWIGRTLSNVYLVESRIGEGGMGAVYVAKHVHLQKSFAVKVLAEAVAGKENAVERLRQEAMAAAKIDHENIVDVVNFDRTPEGAVFIVMERLLGESLAEHIGRGPLELQRALPIAYQICRALHAAHSHGIIHRDLKPENVFLTEKGGRTLVKVLDFGISKIKSADAEQVRMTRTGQLVGTPLYMSPEQARGEGDVDRRVDVYAMGVMLYEMIAGAPPFEGRNYFELLWKHGNEPPPKILERNPNVYVPEALEAVVLRALAKDRDDRFATMEELERALAEAAPEVPALPQLASLPPERPSSAGRTNAPAPPITSALVPAARNPFRLSDARPRTPSEGLSHTLSPSGSNFGPRVLPTRERWPLVAIGVGALLAIGAAAFAMTGGGPEPLRETRAAIAEPPPPEPPPERVEERRDPPPIGVDPPRAPSPISVRLTSIPGGAEVRLDDRVLGTTPLVAPLEPSARALRLTFSRPGFLSETVSVIPAEGLDVPPVRLRRRRSPSRSPSGGELPIKTGL